MAKNTSKEKDESKTRKKEKKMRYGVFNESYKETPVVVIREVDKEGEIIDPNKFPIVSFGKTKLKAIVSCSEQLAEALEELE